jgi:hypothetical protein
MASKSTDWLELKWEYHMDVKCLEPWRWWTGNDNCAQEGPSEVFSKANQASLLAAASCLVISSIQAADRPNVIMILADDLGYADVGLEPLIVGARRLASC